jgi:surfeit locus 1 family protein
MTSAAPTSGGRTLRRALFVLIMLGLTALCVALGLWQWQRLGEKEALIAAVADRLDRPPVAFPPAGEWSALDAASYNFRPVTLTGRYLPDDTVLVFTSLPDPRGQQGGPGFWVMTPLALEGGGTVFVNRGFVPQSFQDAFAEGGAVDPGPVTLTGIARRSEETNAFTPKPDLATHIDYVRNVERLSRLALSAPAPFAPLYVDLLAGAPGLLPQGGETVVEFPNNHLGYALTWFGFAVMAPILLFFWLRRPASRRSA